MVSEIQPGLLLGVWQHFPVYGELPFLCTVTAFQCGCIPRILSNWVISCFYRVEEHQNVRFYRVEEHVDKVVFE